MRRKLYLTLFLTFLLTATLDAVAAILLNHGVPAERIARYIASGVYGKRAFTVPGPTMIIYGVMFHYMIAYAFTAVWFISYPALKRAGLNKWIIGFGYGVVTWLVMTFMVLPISNIIKSKAPMTLYGIGTGIGTLVICIGLPTALIAAWYYGGAGKPARRKVRKN
ncbi:hypothetical protein [Mucilaginibacter agri]|uniref:DUF1440 domain-containing protein n=1 Tax=Mucilaginibacter agri TaxID=2695265 RepID=A0A965ZFR7_9SPHI|nr:hypothetical protein [Mucilaginibacter agri]NCD68972.1 hypothetical protein [Mucilaginibacter agri]